jgi:hypothetical protein
MNTSRASAVSALLVTAFAVVYAAGSAVAGWEPALGWLIQAVIHVGELLAVVALASSARTAPSRTARIGFAAAVVGQLTFAAAEVIWPHRPDLGNVLFGVAPILTGAGLVAVGVAVLRAQVLTGPGRFLPATHGVYTLAVLIPVMSGSGGPPAPAALWTIAGWDLLWCALAASLLMRARALVPATSAAAQVTVR